MPQLTSNDRIPVSNFAICSVRPFGFLSAEDDREQSRETEEYNSEDSHESVATAVLHPDRTELFKIRPEPQIVVGDPNPWPGFTGYPDHIFEHCETADDERCAKEQFELWNPHLFPQKVDIHKEIAQLKVIE
ncbi:hypothetical protein Ddc_23085 [Ditylenchus destructor]|nr:hypothetical protein Ddc_23085 [Ditylenchus destructor]